MLSTFWKSIFKQQLGCRFDIMDSISSYFCILTYAIIYVLIHIILWLYLYFLYIFFIFSSIHVLTPSIDIVLVLFIHKEYNGYTYLTMRKSLAMGVAKVIKVCKESNWTSFTCSTHTYTHSHTHEYIPFLPEASLVIGYCRCLRLHVRPCGNHLLVRWITISS